jgi:hypothetical protein
MPGWDTGRPILHRLPGQNEGYDHEDPTSSPYPPVSDWLTQFWDELLIQTKEKFESFHANYLDPVTALPENLDWLAQMCGFTGAYWDASWPDATKRKLIAQSYLFIWPYKGTRAVLEFMYGEAFGLNARIYILGEFLAGVTQVPAAVGGETLRFYVRVPLLYLRTSPDWGLTDRLRRLYSPAYVDSSVVYERFYAGFSLAGEPVFDQ